MGEVDIARTKEIFGEALERSGPARADFLTKACADDHDLRRRIEALLRAAELDDHFLRDATVAETPPALAQGLGEAPGARIGPYRLLQQIGEGGFGVVFMAEQEHPVRRRVALKIIKLGMDTRAVVARFEQERQALAVLDHPHIAKVLDAGATDSGRPYFVMELVRGEPITAFADARSLTIRERLALFIQVCEAVQHAHTKGIIHRDIKPSNILVSDADARHSARVIDFGIAKATEHRFTDKTLFTEFQQVIGTPEYMSPEQAAGSLDIDTRSDIYSLGVLLYELVTGSTPFDATRLRSAAHAEMQRIIREVDPPRPSTRISQSGPLLADVAARRRLEPRRLGPLVRGELDWIIMKALDKDRARRYESAGELARDITRHLDGHAVAAAPPTTAYRLRKFVRRNRAGVLTATLVFLALLVGVAGTTAGLLEASTARAREAQQATIARRQATIAEAANSFLSAMLERANRGKEGGDPNVTVRQVLDETARELTDSPAASDPAVLVSVHRTIGRTYEGLGLYDESTRHLREALRLAREVHGERTPEAARAMRELASTLFLKDEPLEAEPLARVALALHTELSGPDSIDAAHGHAALGLALGGQRNYADAEVEFARAIAILRAAPDDLRPEIAEVLVNLGLMIAQQNDAPRAENTYREALDIREELGIDETAESASLLNNLAWVLALEGKFDEAEAMYLQTIDLRRRLLGPDHPLLAMSINNLGGMFQRKREPARAEPLMREALEIRRKALGEESTYTIGSIENLASVLHDLGRFDESEELHKQSLDLRRRVLGDTHPDVADSLGNLASLYLSRGRVADAEPLFREALDIRRRAHHEPHPDLPVALVNLAVCLARQEKFDEAVDLTREALNIRLALQAGDPRPLAIARMNFGLLLVSALRFDEAQPVLRDALASTRTAFGENDPRTLSCVAALGHTLAELAWARPPADAAPLATEGETLLRTCLDARTGVLRADDPQLLITQSWLGGAIVSAERALGPQDAARLRVAQGLLLPPFDAFEKTAGTSSAARTRARLAAERIARLHEVWASVEPDADHAARTEQWRARLPAAP